MCKNRKKSVSKNRIQAGTTPGKCCIVTFSDRKSRFLVAKSVDKVSSQKVHDAIKEAFNEKGIHPKRRVFDNGSESSKFIELETTLQTSIYFADIHSPWQRGSNAHAVFYCTWLCNVTLPHIEDSIFIFYFQNIQRHRLYQDKRHQNLPLQFYQDN
ncbi:DDE-type integrase/transposase/recombinase [Treponema pectinovorum]